MAWIYIALLVLWKLMIYNINIYSMSMILWNFSIKNKNWKFLITERLYPMWFFLVHVFLYKKNIIFADLTDLVLPRIPLMVLYICANLSFHVPYTSTYAVYVCYTSIHTLYSTRLPCQWSENPDLSYKLVLFMTA